MNGSLRNRMRQGLLAAGVIVALSAQAGDPALESRVEAARKKLDEAAAELTAAVAAAYAHPDPAGERAFLGILLEDHDGDEHGITLGGVTPGGGAASAGLAAGDTLTRIDDVVLAGVQNPGKLLLAAMDNLKPGAVVRVTYLRAGQEYHVDVTTTGMFKTALASIEPKLAPWIEEQGIRGIAKFMLDPERSTAVLIDVRDDLASYFGVSAGVLVLHVPEHAGGLKAGDVLLAVDDQPPANANDAQARLFEGGAAGKVLRIRRKGKESELTIDPDDYRVDGQTRVFVYRFDDVASPVPAPVKGP